MRDTQEKRPVLSALRYGLLLAVSAAALTGCVSAVPADMQADIKSVPDKETVAESGAQQTTTPTVAGAAATASQATAQAAAATGVQAEGEAARDMAGTIMQPTSLNAGKASIYSNGGQIAPIGAAYATQTGTNAAVNSLYAGAGGDAGQTGRLPVEDMPTVGATEEQSAVFEDGQNVVLPQNIPVPRTARTALVEEAAAGNAADMALATPESSLFADRSEATDAFDAERFAQKPRRVLNRDSAGAVQMASLGALPGVKSANALAASDPADHPEAEEVEDDAPQFKEVASLAGLARLAPNGLWLQTENVRTGCFKPELLQVLKTIEKHYDKPVIVTSGLRDLKVNRARQSLHTRCEAADIQIAGVGKWELADYLRSMPGRGGVGTYCHTESVHIDIGPERDWNWRCRRRK